MQDKQPGGGAALHTFVKALFTVIAVILWLWHLGTGKPSLTAFLITTALFVFITVMLEPRKAPTAEDD